MSFREALQKRPRLTAGVTAAVVVIALAYAAYQVRREAGPRLPTLPSMAFYSTDDGASLFADGLFKVPPIKHDGKDAVRAHVFTCDGGKHQWVQFLEKYSDANRQALEAQSGAPSNRPMWRLVKRPGGGAWVPENSPEGLAAMDPKCPDGASKSLIEPVLP